MGVAQPVRQSAVHAEGLQLQPDEAEAVFVEEHEEPGRSLWAGEAVAGDLPCPVEAESKKGSRESLNALVFCLAWGLSGV